MPTVTLLVGIPASGKSTYAKQSGLPTVSRDAIRKIFPGGEDKTVFDYKVEEIVTGIEKAQTEILLKSGYDVIVDDMNLRPKYVKEWIKFAHENDSQVDLVKFPVDVEEAVRRNSLREDAIPEDALRTIAQKFTKKGIPTVDLVKCYTEVVEEASPKSKKYVPDTTKPKTIIVDLDGTLAHNNSGRDWYALDDSYLQDDVDEAVQFLVESFQNKGYTVVFMSGRDERTRDVTEKWLFEKAGFDAPILFMRPAEDKRPDSIVKLELFDKYVRDNYNVTLTVDDRAQVCKMWRALPIKTWSVAEGNF